jgi:hypothetical protein
MTAGQNLEMFHSAQTCGQASKVPIIVAPPLKIATDTQEAGLHVGHQEKGANFRHVAGVQI